MDSHSLTILSVHLLNLATGAAIGLAFGFTGRSAAADSPSPLRKVWKGLVFLLVLAALPFVSPFYYYEGSKWWILAGIALGNGWQLLRRLRLRLEQTRG